MALGQEETWHSSGVMVIWGCRVDGCSLTHLWGQVLTKQQQEQAASNDFNFDHPDAFDFDLIIATLKKLKQGKSVKIPIYDFTTHSRKKEWVWDVEGHGMRWGAATSVQPASRLQGQRAARRRKPMGCACVTESSLSPTSDCKAQEIEELIIRCVIIFPGVWYLCTRSLSNHIDFLPLQKTLYGANVIIFEGIMAFADKELLKVRQPHPAARALLGAVGMLGVHVVLSVLVAVGILSVPVAVGVLVAVGHWVLHHMLHQHRLHAHPACPILMFHSRGRAPGGRGAEGRVSAIPSQEFGAKL